jgi:hypothetical protein
LRAAGLAQVRLGCEFSTARSPQLQTDGIGRPFACVHFPCVHAAATTPAQRLGLFFAQFTQPYQPSPKGPSGRPAHRPFEACSAFTRVAACTLARPPIRDPLSEGFSHFVASMTAPVASGWSGCRVGLAPTGKRRLVTAHTRFRHCVTNSGNVLSLDYAPAPPGRRTVKTEPLPGSLITVTSPPIMRASLRVIARPRPVPP